MDRLIETSGQLRLHHMGRPAMEIIWEDEERQRLEAQFTSMDHEPDFLPLEEEVVVHFPTA